MKTFRTVMPLIAFAVAAVSCQREDFSVVAPTSNPAAIIATISDDATRAIFTDNAGAGVALTWEAGDEIMIYSADGNYAATFTTSAGGGATATFTLTDGSAADGNYTAVYPAYYTSPGVPAPTLAHRAEVVNGLTQDGDSSTAHLDPQSYMSGTLAYSSGDVTSNAVALGMEFALLTVEMAIPTGYVAATHGAPTSLTFYNGGKTTALFLENISTTDMESGLTLYMMMDPYNSTTARSLYFELLTKGNGVFVMEKANVSKGYEAGKRYTATLSGADALELTTGIYTLETAPSSPTDLPTTCVLTDVITNLYSASMLSNLNLGIRNSGKDIRVILPNATSIANDVFKDCKPGLVSVSMPEVITFGNSAFNSCTALTSVSLPKATTFGNDAFRSCAALVSASLPAVTTLGNYPFYECDNLTSVSLPAATIIGSNAFQRCYELTSLDLPNLLAVEMYLIAGSTKLTSLILPKAEAIKNYALYNGTTLTSISLPAATSIGNQAFTNCAALKFLEIGGAAGLTSVGTSIFNGCVVGNIHLTVGSGETSYVTDGNTKWRGYGPFADITIKP